MPYPEHNEKLIDAAAGEEAVRPPPMPGASPLLRVPPMRGARAGLHVPPMRGAGTSPSADAQIRAAKESYMRYVNWPAEARVAQREALVARRHLHRLGTDYEEIEETLRRDLDAYQDEYDRRVFARDFYRGATSVAFRRKRKNRRRALYEDEKRARHRERIIELADQLDEIDAAAGFDSAGDYDFKDHGPPPGDTHSTRAWQSIMFADWRLLDCIVARHRMAWPSWIGWAALVVAVPAGLLLYPVWSAASEGMPFQSAATAAALILGLLAIWLPFKRKTSDFIVAVCDVRGEHQHAYRELARHRRNDLLSIRRPRPFDRDPAEQPLTDLLRRH